MRRVNKLYIILLIVLLNSIISSQVKIGEKIDVLAEIEAGSIELSINPPTLEAEIDKLFDGEPFTELGVNDKDSLSITLLFDEAVKVSKNKVFFMITSGEWSLESASSLDDLNNQTGTYTSWTSNQSYNAFSWDSVSIASQSINAVRLTARNLENSIVHLGEWELYSEIELVSLYILPHPPKLIPGTNLELTFGALDEFNNFYEFESDEDIVWSSSNPSVASFNDEMSVMTGNAVGTTEITVRTASNSISGTAIATVIEDFESEADTTMHVKVAVVYQNPVVSAGTRLHTKFNWYNPYEMVEQLVEEYKSISGGVVEYEIVEVHDDQQLFTKLDSTYLTVNQLVEYYNEPGWTTIRRLAETEHRIKFDYKGMVEYYDFYNKRENGEIDEIWVYSHPFGGMYESQLIGKDAIWWNSPPIKDVPDDFTKLLSVMGWNYERTVDLAMHSMGHRMESAVREAYGRWDVFNEDPNEWELFTRIDKDWVNGAHVGNIHFPPNGTSDYDYSNTRVVKTYAKNWKRYPYLLDESEMVNCEEWGCDQYGYMRWWFNHIPRYKGITNGVLNNWWQYFIDFQRAQELENQTFIVGVRGGEYKLTPTDFNLEQNYPNPFNPSTSISFSLQSSADVKLQVFNSLGQLVDTLLNDRLSPGSYVTQWKPSGASGVYFCRITIADTEMSSQNYSDVIKMVFLK